MKTTLYRACVLLFMGATAGSIIRALAPEPDSPVPLLTLDEAISIATGNNREKRISTFEIAKAKETVAQARTNFLAKLEIGLKGTWNGGDNAEYCGRRDFP